MLPCVETRRARPLLGTFVEISARAPNELLLQRAVTRGFAAIERVQRLMSFHERGSDVSRLNREAARTSVRVHHWTARVLRAAQRFARESDGAFDVTVATSLRDWRLLPNSGVRQCTGTWREISITRDNRVRFHRPLIIDFGGIAKGFAVDRAIDAIQQAGASGAVVNAGGDLRVFGGRPELVRIRDAKNPGRVGGVVSLRDRAVATSALYFSKDAERLVSPLLDGRDRKAIMQDLSATVSADDCMSADALTKIVLALRDEAQPILRRHSADAFLLDASSPVRWISQTDAPQCHQA